MALNASGAISLAGTTVGQSIALELGESGVTLISIGDVPPRKLAEVLSGTISFSNFWGKSSNEYWIMTTSVPGTSSASIDYNPTSKIAYLRGTTGTTSARVGYIIKYNNDTNTTIWAKNYYSSSNYGIFPWATIQSLGVGQDQTIYIGIQGQQSGRTVYGSQAFTAIVDSSTGDLYLNQLKVTTSTANSGGIALNSNNIQGIYPTTWLYGPYQLQILNSSSLSPLVATNIATRTDYIPSMVHWSSPTVFFVTGASGNGGLNTYPMVQKFVNNTMTNWHEFGAGGTDSGTLSATLNPINNYLYVYVNLATRYLFRYTPDLVLVDSTAFTINFIVTSIRCDYEGNIYLSSTPVAGTSLITKISPDFVILWQRELIGGTAICSKTEFSDGIYLNVAASTANVSLWKLPLDGSKTGNYTINGVSFTYRVASTYALTLTPSTHAQVTVIAPFGGGGGVDYGTYAGSSANLTASIIDTTI